MCVKTNSDIHKRKQDAQKIKAFPEGMDISEHCALPASPANRLNANVSISMESVCIL